MKQTLWTRNFTLVTVASALGAMGEVLDYRWCMTACGGFCMAACFLTIWKNRREVRRVYEQTEEQA